MWMYAFTWWGDCAGWGEGLGAWPGLWGGPCCGEGGGCGWPLGPGLAAGDGPPGGHGLDGSEYYKENNNLISFIMVFSNELRSHYIIIKFSIIFQLFYLDENK